MQHRPIGVLGRGPMPKLGCFFWARPVEKEAMVEELVTARRRPARLSEPGLGGAQPRACGEPALARAGNNDQARQAEVPFVPGCPGREVMPSTGTAGPRFQERETLFRHPQGSLGTQVGAIQGPSSHVSLGILLALQRLVQPERSIPVNKKHPWEGHADRVPPRWRCCARLCPDAV
ncbi:hypothetical protein GQ53DRAFT_124294 [Thozetella sp. PMI_491]|nr:hypothetical protein GQ53DRAFT_124294 [Thozetella sp. PMI_491]